MIINLGHPTHPKAEILLIDFKKGKVDFRWLEADETPSKIYSGDCSATVELAAVKTLAEAEPIIQASIIDQAGLSIK